MHDTQEHYLLLTPGPLTTSDTVRQSMLKDWCTWDDDYNQLVQSVRRDLVRLALNPQGDSAAAEAQHDNAYTAVLMQGSGTASVEATLGTAIGPDDKLLILSNGAYGQRMAEIARYLGLNHQLQEHNELDEINLERLTQTLASDPSFSHVCVVHCETTTGRLNPIADIGHIVKAHNCQFIVDAMSSFGGLPIQVDQLDIDFLVSSANKCIQGVPGFGFVIAKRSALEPLAGRARSLSLDLHAQWRTMEDQNGKWRFTSPTHVVRAFRQALDELFVEGVNGRLQRYRDNQSSLVAGMAKLGFNAMVDECHQSPFITSFFYPEHFAFEFKPFYQALKQHGFVIYPGKVSNADCFRIGTIGEVYPADIARLLSAIEQT
ncbi:MAG: 2-aminoethylphosphonate--pyruvate transaminase, partial [Cellvibrionaceae bacterium]|nr:2-aminoethylphosphonate--pyruvate transaminase [Cellvibrionaceae bacterium]